MTAEEFYASDLPYDGRGEHYTPSLKFDTVHKNLFNNTWVRKFRKAKDVIDTYYGRQN